MYGKEKIKRELEKDNVFVSVSTVGRVLKYLMEQKNTKYTSNKKKKIFIFKNSQTRTFCIMYP